MQCYIDYSGLIFMLLPSQILESWRSKRVIDPQKVDDVLACLDARQTSLEQAGDAPSARPATALPRAEVFKRIEEDRERHKRLRERRWVQPVSHAVTTHLPPPLAAFLPLAGEDNGGDSAGDLPLDIEFENDWETTSDWNEDDDDAAMEENQLCFPSHDGEQAMDLS